MNTTTPQSSAATIPSSRGTAEHPARSAHFPGASPWAVTRLHASKRFISYAVAPIMLLIVFAVTAVITVIAWRVGVDPTSINRQYNSGLIWAFVGYFGYLGVQTVAGSFPFALGLGTTRRAFTLGTFAYHVLLASYLTAVYIVALAIELATDQWFSDLYVLNVVAGGSGDPVELGLRTFFISLVTLSFLGLFGAAYTRTKNRGVILLSVGLAILAALVIIVGIPYLGDILAAFQPWWLVIAAVVMIAGSVLGQYLFLRGASVR